ncbi:unnamed protein product [Heligmosomoides polygyrus]|uniref:Transmembrane protein n=1 Tax=Heligmosomoides polygyrus TaxID=6339 RepID=A0A183G1D2_HELPZ|nr:unnamed protein product [Heligmosomoides polygyrus]
MGFASTYKGTTIAGTLVDGNESLASESQPDATTGTGSRSGECGSRRLQCFFSARESLFSARSLERVGCDFSPVTVALERSENERGTTLPSQESETRTASEHAAGDETCDLGCARESDFGPVEV